MEKTYDRSNSHFKKNGSNWLTVSKFDLELIKLDYKLISLEDPNDITKESLSEIKFSFILQNSDLDNKYNYPYKKEFKLKDFWIKNIN